MKDFRFSSGRVQIAFFASLVFFADQAVKLALRSRLSPGDSIPLIRNVMHVTYVRNFGAGFGILQGYSIILAVFSLVTLAAIAFFYRSIPESRSKALSIGLITGGAMSNFSDRIFLGHVVDFIDMRIWPVFNIGDIGITLGAVLIIWSMIRKQK